MTGCTFGCLVVPTCMFVVRMCFRTLLTAPLLQKKSSTLHHEEALTQAAKRNGREELQVFKHRRYRSDNTVQNNSSAQLFQPVHGTANEILSLTGWFSSVDMANEMSINLDCLLPVNYLSSGKAQLPRYRGRPQVCSSHESSFDPECLAVFFLLHGLHSDLTCQVYAGLV